MKRKLSQRFGEQLLEIHLDRREVYPDDPGRGTPAMVILRDYVTSRELDSGTYWCAIGDDELSYNGTQLSKEQVKWLVAQEPEITEFLYR